MRFLTACLACIVPAIWGQQTQPEVVSHEAPVTFSSRVNLVSVPVVIRDKDGKSVGGLRQEDFQLSDKGKPQVITKFTIQTNVPAPANGPAALAAAKTAEAAAPGPAAAPELPDRYVAYFFDDVHMQPGDLLNARKAASAHLDTALDPNTRAGIFTTSGRFTQVFTNDSVKLHDALNRIQPWTSINTQECLQVSYYIADYLINWEHSLSPFGVVGLSSSGAPSTSSSSGSSSASSAAQPSTSLTQVSPLAEELLTEAAVCLNVQPPPQADPAAARYLWTTANNVLVYGLEETNSGLTVLKDLIAKMSALPGSRTVVLVSPGFIMAAEHRNAENDILERAVRANVVINSLDIRGVYSPLRSRSYDTEYGGNFGGPANGGKGALLYQERERANREELTAAGNVLAELAYGTGGTVHNDNDFEGGLKQLAGRPEYVYVLGFSPDNLKNDGSYHALKVKLKEPAKLDVEARRGYWAPSHAVDPAEEAKEELKETLFSRDELADIPLDVHAEFFKSAAGSEAGKSQINVVSRLDTKELRFRKADERNKDTLTVVTGLFDQNGNYISGIERVVELSLRDKSLQTLENSGISVEQSFSVTPGRYIVRVVVKDGEGHSTAARNTGIEVP